MTRVKLVIWAVLSGCAASAVASTIALTPTGSFTLDRLSTAGIVVDDTTIYVTFSGRAEMDTYDLSGSFLATIPLIGGSALYDGYVGAAMKDDDELYLTAMRPGGRDAGIDIFTKTGAFVGAVDPTPALQNPTGIAFDGTDIYLNQNDAPYAMYRIDADTGAVLQTFDFYEPLYDQRLGLCYCPIADALIETYDYGISVLDPIDGSELQHFTREDLGYGRRQVFSADVSGDTLYLMVHDITVTRVYTYTIEPDCLGDLDGDGQVGLSDLAILLAHYDTTSGATYDDGDLDEDGDVDLADLAALLAVYGMECP